MCLQQSINLGSAGLLLSYGAANGGCQNLGSILEVRWFHVGEF